MQEQYNKLIDSEVFKKWKKKHKDSYLCSCFNARDGVNDAFWNFDFYNKNDRITTFGVANEIIVNENQEIFKKDKEKIAEICLDDVKIKLDKAIELIEKPEGEKFNKIISILQFKDILMWNITMISESFNILNVKINAVNGEEIYSNLGSVMDYRKIIK